MKIIELEEKGLKILRENNIEDSSLKIKILLSNILRKTKEYIMIHNDDEVSFNIEKEFLKKIDRIKKNEPIQYVINSQEFMGFMFYVDENVLIPQPDTEILVEEVINIVKNNFSDKVKILDLCTGSGAIGISIAKLLENSSITVSDIDEKCLQIAKRNAIKNDIKIDIVQSDIFKNFSKINKFDIIVSNPPYIREDIIKTLPKEVQKEPYKALNGGKDGLHFYREIVNNAQNFLNPNGYLALEIGYDQKEDVKKILEKNKFKNIYSKKDLSGNDRIVVGKRE